jgi:hypothetical protein
VEKDNQHNMNQDEEKELNDALSNEALTKIENHLTKAELDKLAAFFAKEMLNNPSQEKPKP